MPDPDLVQEQSSTRPETMADWNRLINLMHIMVRSLMRGRDRDQRESIDVVQSLAGELLSKGSGVFDLAPEAQRKYIKIALRNRLARYARSDHALKRGGPGSVPSPLDPDFAIPPPSAVAGPSTLCLQAEELQAVAQGLDELEPESRAVLALFSSGASHSEIADFLQTTDVNARQRFVRAKRDLIILTLRKLGHNWDDIAAASGIDAGAAMQRHSKLVSAKST